MEHSETKHDNPVLDRAGEDEPIFVLRARDALAGAAIGEWIRAARRCGVSEAKIEDARLHLALMDRWAAANGTKVPD